ncbi:MAG TPA: hypothetical protein VGR15_04130, partial [Bacteroidota bacterium]|nr:hypothetical protein [Bacteroidota bacterium]
MMNLKYVVIGVLLACVLPPLVHTQPTRTAGDSTTFDFWIGEWDLRWSFGDSAAGHGRNTLTKILDGTVIEEQFEALTGSIAGLKGMSLSVFTHNDGRWHQTWVDNDGSYLDFAGGLMGDKPFFER